MRFLLIHPASTPVLGTHGARRWTDHIFRQSILPCLYVAAAAPPWVQTRIVDEDIEPIDFDAPADLVGLSFMTLSAPRAYEIAARFRRRGIPVVMGGYHPTVAPADVAPHADSVCVGDAENKMVQICEDARDGRLRPIYDGPPPALDDLPVLDRRSLSWRDRGVIDTILSTRGCPYRCTFCSVTAFHRHTYRTRRIAQVVEELTTLRRRVLFVDDNLTADRDYALELFAAIAPLGKRWYAQSNISIAEDDELLRRAVVAGCRGLFVGLESISVANLFAWRKAFNRPARYARAVRTLHEAGIAVFAGIVFGMDDDTAEIFPRTLAFLEGAKVDFLAANILTPFPGTPLYDTMRAEGRITDQDWANYDFNHVVFEPRRMSAETLLSGTYWVRAQFYRRRAFARRLLESLRYLDPGTLVQTVIPLTVGLRSLMARNGRAKMGLQYRPEGSP